MSTITVPPTIESGSALTIQYDDWSRPPDLVNIGGITVAGLLKKDTFTVGGDTALSGYTSDEGGGWSGADISGFEIEASTDSVRLVSDNLYDAVGTENPTTEDYYTVVVGTLGTTTSSSRIGAHVRHDGGAYNSNTSYRLIVTEGGWVLDRIVGGVATSLSSDLNFVTNNNITGTTTLTLRLQVKTLDSETVRLNAFIQIDTDAEQHIVENFDDTSGDRIVTAGNIGIHLRNQNARIQSVNAYQTEEYESVPVTAEWPIQGTTTDLAYRPHIRGFGYNSYGGSGRNTAATPAILRVTNTNEDGVGSFKQALQDHNDRNGDPSIIVFEVSGTTYWLNDHIFTIREPNLTIAGQTAPSPGFTVGRSRINIRENDVVIQHLRTRFGSDTQNMDASDINNATSIMIDGLEGQNERVRILLDHVSASWGIDALIGAPSAAPFQLLCYNCLIYEGLNHDPSGTISRGFDCLPQPNDITVQSDFGVFRSVVANNYQRNPRTRGLNSHFVNCVGYNWGDTRNLALFTESGGGEREVRAMVRSSKFIPEDINNGPIGIDSKTSASLALYAFDNDNPKYSGDEWDLVNNESNVARNDIEVGQAGINYPEGLVPLDCRGNADFESTVLADAGARPLDRDSQDERIINEIATRTGTPIQSNADGALEHEDNVGGFPTLAVNTKAYVDPDNPDDIMASGYTRREEYLEQLARDLEP